MAALNTVGAQLLCKYKSNACTDVTGFGILGHANYLAQAHKNHIKFVIELLSSRTFIGNDDILQIV
jgi:selenide,water dikinase